MTTRYQHPGNHLNRKATADELRDVPAIESRQDYLDAVNDPQFKTSQLYRELVSAAVGKSDQRLLFTGVPTNNEPERAPAAMIEARRSTMQNLFNDPRYKTDAAYRWQVMERVKEMTAGDQYETTPNPLSAGGGCTSVSLSTKPNQAAEIRTTGVNRVQFMGEQRNFVGEALSVRKKTDQ